LRIDVHEPFGFFLNASHSTLPSSAVASTVRLCPRPPRAEGDEKKQPEQTHSHNPSLHFVVGQFDKLLKWSEFEDGGTDARR
jgi:hypothetical protein